MMSGGQKKGWRIKKYLSLESLLESENRRVNSILKLDIVVIALLQKGFGINLAHYKKCVMFSTQSRGVLRVPCSVRHTRAQPTAQQETGR